MISAQICGTPRPTYSFGQCSRLKGTLFKIWVDHGMFGLCSSVCKQRHRIGTCPSILPERRGKFRQCRITLAPTAGNYIELSLLNQSSHSRHRNVHLKHLVIRPAQHARPQGLILYGYHCFNLQRLEETGDKQLFVGTFTNIKSTGITADTTTGIQHTQSPLPFRG